MIERCGAMFLAIDSSRPCNLRVSPLPVCPERSRTRQRLEDFDFLRDRRGRALSAFLRGQLGYHDFSALKTAERLMEIKHGSSGNGQR
jgi:hypothetical protein